MHHIALSSKAPVFRKQDKVPPLSNLSLHLWILVHTFIPLVIHQLFISLTGNNFGFPTALIFYYTSSVVLTGLSLAKMMGKIGLTHGFFDGDKHERGSFPEAGQTAVSAFLGAVLRVTMTAYLAYDICNAPSYMNWAWLPIEIGLYGITVDFWYYWYHRSMHEVDGLWKYHRTHHLAKHPTLASAIYFDPVQAFFDVAVIPLMAFLSMKFMGFPMGFYECYICQVYVAIAEFCGHSGIRVHVVAPNPLSVLLEYFDAELTIEDHDLHHRDGWRKSSNYGKQTRLWDRVFGTCRDRIETVKDNVDYDRTVWASIL